MQPRASQWRGMYARAASQARRASAFRAAQTYAATGLGLLGKKPAASEREHWLGLSLDGAEASLLVGDYDAMDVHVEAVLAASNDPLERVRAHEIRVSACNARNDLVGAVQCSLLALRELGVDLPNAPSQGAVMGALVQTKFALRGVGRASFTDLPDTDDLKVVHAVGLMMNLIGPAYYASPNLLPLLAFRTVRLALDRGVCAGSATGLSLFGLVLCTLGDIRGAYEFGGAAMDIADRFDGSRYATRARHLYNTHIRFWMEPWTASVDALRETHEHAYVNGDFEYAAFSGFMRCAFMSASGRELGDVLREMGRMSRALDEMQQGTSARTLGIVRQAALNFTDAPPGQEPWALAGDAYDEAVQVPEHLEASDTTNLFCYYSTRMKLAYMFGAYDVAYEAALAASPYEDGAASTWFIPDAVFFEIVTRLRHGENLGRLERAKNQGRVTMLERRLRKYTELCPHNLACRLELVQAEKARARVRARVVRIFERIIRSPCRCRPRLARSPPAAGRTPAPRRRARRPTPLLRPPGRAAAP